MAVDLAVDLTAKCPCGTNLKGTVESFLGCGSVA
jgi:hypothetical protein